MMRSTGEWVLRRVGFKEPEFTLQDHVSQVSLGRSEGSSKQCLSVNVSRQHALLNKVMGDDGLPYWKLRHISRTSFTYVNGNELKLNAEIRLNDRDLISLGYNLSPEQCEGQIDKFLFRILAPTLWNNISEVKGVNAIDATQSILESDTPPRVPSPTIKIEPGEVIHTESRYNDPALPTKRKYTFDLDLIDSKSNVMAKSASELAPVHSNKNLASKSHSFPSTSDVKVEKSFDSKSKKRSTIEKGLHNESERNEELETVFSQVEEVIILDDSEESDFLCNTFSNDYADEQIKVKIEPHRFEENDANLEDDDIQIIIPPEKEYDVIDLDDTELELDDSQKNLYHRIAHKIKTEKEYPIKVEPRQIFTENHEDHESDDEIIFLGENENPFETSEATKEKIDVERNIESHKETSESEKSKDSAVKDLKTSSEESNPANGYKKIGPTHRPPVIIDALPQVRKRRTNRSNSKEAKKPSEDCKRVGLPTLPTKGKDLSNLKLKRSQKLKYIATKDPPTRKINSNTSRPAIKMYSTLPKLEKNGLGNSSLVEDQANSNLKRSIGDQEFSNSVSSPDENAEPVYQSDLSFKIPIIPPLPKRLRVQAETVADEDGLKRIAKLKFNNVISNTSSQDISNVPIEVPKMLCYPSISDLPPKKVRWRSRLTTVKEIPSVGKGLKVNSNKDCPSSLRISKPVPPKYVVKSEFTIDKIITHILSWNTSWLEEQTRVNVSPQVDLNRFKMVHVPPVFDNYEDYCQVFFPLLFHELWQTVFRDYLKQKDMPIRQVAEIFNIKEYKEGQISSFSARSLLTTQDKSACHYIPRGTLIKINLFNYAGTKSIVRPCFGFVTQNKLIRRTDSTICDNLLKTYPSSLRNKLTFINEYSVIALSSVLSKMSKNPRTKFPVVELVSYINPSLRLFGAVIDAKKSPLFSSLLKHEDSSSVSTIPGPQDVITPHLNKLNPIQRKIVLDISETCALSSPTSPFLSLIQGPPGTGKSTVITSLVIQILSRFCKEGHVPPKILITAPSNSAVDELVKKLQELVGNEIKMVRVGQLGSMDRHVKNLELTQLVHRQLQDIEARLGNNKSIKLEISHRQEEINHIGLEIEKEVTVNPGSSKINLLQRQLKDEQEKLQRAKRNIKNYLSAHEKERKKQELTRMFLDDSDIIATTLSSSLNGQMINHFLRPENKPKRSISICIVDEASQCVEPEGLVPLGLGFSKLIMVGDPEQLPATVSSMKAKDLSYGQSLFNRLFKSSRNCNTSTSIHRLTIQYRMNGEIARWPNHYFYGGDLTNGKSWGARKSILFPLKLFDLSWTKMEATGIERSIFNTKEAKFVAHLASELMNHALPGDKTLGVITFYSQQRKHLSLELQNLGIETTDGKNSSKTAVAVSTVDGFQGSECDVVIISCVRSDNKVEKSEKASIGFISQSERLNVALTRARFALYIVGDFQTLSRSVMWNDLLKDVRKRKCIVSIGEDYDAKTLRSQFLKP